MEIIKVAKSRINSPSVGFPVEITVVEIIPEPTPEEKKGMRKVGKHYKKWWNKDRY